MDGVILPVPHTPSWSAQGQLYVCISELVPCVQQSTIFFCSMFYYCRAFCRWWQLMNVLRVCYDVIFSSC
jgi:hypothetical protein